MSAEAMNGNEMPDLSKMLVNPVVGLLKGMLAEAEAGRVTSVAVVGITVQGVVMSGHQGPQRGDLFVGVSLIKDRMLKEFGAPAPRSSIIPVRPAG